MTSPEPTAGVPSTSLHDTGPSTVPRRRLLTRFANAAALVAVPVAGYQWARSTSVVVVMTAYVVFVAAAFWLCRHAVGERT